MGYYEEKKEYEEDKNKSNLNKCPECKKGIMVVAITPKVGFGQKHTFKSFCPVCGHTIKKEV